MEVSVIIVNWNTKKLTADAIASVFKFTKGVTFEVIVIDNASEDGSGEFIKKKFPQVKLIENKQNVGFGNANNQGMKEARGEYIFLLNSDAFLIENSLPKLIKKAREVGNLGMLGPQLLNEDRTIQQSVGFFPHLLQVFLWMSFIDDLPFGALLAPYHVDHDSFYKQDHQVDWITGAAMLIPKKTIAKTGTFDSEIFMYGEDVDWCFRIKGANLKVVYSPVTKLVHIGRGSANKISKNAILGEYGGIKYFYKKHKGNISLQLARLLLKIGALARIAVFSLLGRKETAKFYVEALKMA